MPISVDDKKNTLHSNVSISLVAFWILGSFVSIYFFKSGYINRNHIIYLAGWYFFLWMIIDLLLGVYFKEFPQFIASIKLKSNPKTYFFRILFDLALICMSGYIVFFWVPIG